MTVKLGNDIIRAVYLRSLIKQNSTTKGRAKVRANRGYCVNAGRKVKV